MKLYQSLGPNPRVVLMYLAETNVQVDRRFVDIMAAENRQPDFCAKSPLGHTPVLELDDGSCIAESVAICEYLDETLGRNALLGATPEERAQTRMLVRIVDQLVVVPMTAGFRGAEGLPMFQSRLLCLPDAAADLKRLAADGLAQVDRILGAGQWLAGDRFSLADILLYSFVEFGAMVGQPLDPALTNLAAWRGRVAARPSAAASANPQMGIGEPA
ncbi:MULTISPECIES: glutathione S-transferase family protein [unclassified Sphingopyxis]|jgi:glutathione S-transferase|uniref:glutathione S-transferase family protein n=1 Tax=unclassified Sphingopyxis TaxID=2614943 RepID=UPI0006C4F70A|nr:MULTISPECIES: glutathione S-transferase family protein [unclassified Sphingopyxis]USI76687.1 glutathione S-transferase family protein [Sphingopyxis sp. USTB-05]GAO80893.1 glutathione S-transferase [Sphingopyxis sp. C-1]